MKRAILLLAFTTATHTAAFAGTAREITLDQRVEAQRAIERIYQSHQTGNVGRFEQAIPRSVSRDKVRSYLRESAALESLWRTPVTSEMLRSEVARMARATRMPERLFELYRALGNDSVLIQECLARPVLVDRLARSYFASDQRLRKGPSVEGASEAPAPPGASHPSWDEWWAAAQARFDENSVRSVARDAALPEPAPSTSGQDTFEATAASCSPEGVWQAMGSNNVPSPRTDATAVWTGAEMIVWGGSDYSRPLNSGGRYNPAIDAWFPLTRIGAPAARQDHVAVWSGSRMIVWGGRVASPASPVSGGGLYDPLTDSWTAMNVSAAPPSRWGTTAVWTGTEMAVWGGYDGAQYLDTGVRYDPSSDTWSLMSTSGAPSARSGHSTVWTGSRMIVWGGSPGLRNDGALYDPASDAWTAMATTGAPGPRSGHAAVWIGTEMIVWGGYDGSMYSATGGRYAPATDTWDAVSASGAPAGAQSVSAAWTGNAMFVWGGRAESGGHTNEGATYDPGSNSWTAIPVFNAPSARSEASALWTGSQIVLWGGWNLSGPLADGGRYDVAAGAWLPVASNPIPSLWGGKPVWTGSVMLVWPTAGSGGHRYDPLTDTWTPIASAGAPAISGDFTSVWTGSKMIVWGEGGQPHPSPGVGGLYDPASDAWTLTTTVGAPSSRRGHTAVWTGTRMIVWGGLYTSFGDDFALGDGYSFDPQANAWSPIASSGLVPRGNHAAVWTGSRMLIWGGVAGDIVMGYPTLGDGARYDPSTNTWSAINSTGAPAGRHLHSAVWAFNRMIIWGGATCPGDGHCTDLASGGRYNPTLNAWTAVGTAGDPPPPMSGHAAVWTGQAMVVYKGPSRGGMYTPLTDTWVRVAAADAPALLDGAVWAGSSMIVSASRFFPDVNSDVDGDGWNPCDGDCDDSRASVHPGAAEVCNGIDDDCDDVTDGGGPLLCADAADCTTDICAASRGCLHAMAADGASCSDGDACTNADSCLSGSCRPGPMRDGDADLHADAACGGDDCDDADSAVWHAPTEVTGLDVAAGPTPTLSWEDQGPLAGPGTVYDLFSGSFSSTGLLDFSIGSCLMTGGQPSFDDGSSGPAPGVVRWYLSRARNGCGTSTWGSAGADAQIRSCQSP